jgi:hypothetical protein
MRVHIFSLPVVVRACWKAKKHISTIWCCHLGVVIFGVVIWRCHMGCHPGCHLTLSSGLSSDIVIWGCHLPLSSGVIIWRCHLGLSSDVFIWGCHLMLSSGVVIWRCHLGLLSLGLKMFFSGNTRELWKLSNNGCVFRINKCKFCLSKILCGKFFSREK